MAPRRKSPTPAAAPAEPAQVEHVDVADELSDAFLTYAITVIVARAIPDARDGLKPAQRRLLYAMWKAGLGPDKPHRKSVAAVSETMKTYHPYGDAAIYDTLVRLAQPWVVPVTLVDGHGNFGGPDDPPAAQRYTEARLTPAATALLAELAEDTVDTRPNFDATTTEPVVLPAAWPTLLVNGSSGIAVGMATSIPPHNLAEVLAAAQAYLVNPKVSLDELLKLCPGPDFPGGGVIADPSPLRDIYATGRGTVRLRANLEVSSAGRHPTLVVSELPYQVGPEKVVARIRELIVDGKLDDVVDVEDHSDRLNGLRLVVTLVPGADPAVVAADLFRATPLEDTVAVNLVALVDGVPRTCSLIDLLAAFVAHRLEVTRRRSAHRRAKAAERLVVVDALLAALDHLDEVIAIVRSTKSTDAARTKIAKLLRITPDAANAVLDLSLRRLGALERSRLATERKDLRATIAELDKLLASPKRLAATVANELAAAAATFSSPRRTALGATPLAQASLNAAAQTSATGGLTLTDDATVGVGAGGVVGAAALVDANGRVVLVDAAQVPTAARVPAAQLAPALGDPVALVPTDTDWSLVVVTSTGGVKRVAADALELRKLRRAGAAGKAVVSLADSEVVVAAWCAPDDADALVLASDGHVLRFAVADVRPRREAAGTMAGMALANGAHVVGAGDASRAGAAFRPPRARTDKVVPGTEVPLRRRGAAGVWVAGRRVEVTNLAVVTTPAP